MSTGVTPIKYEWADGYPSKVDPEIAGRELERLAKRDQEIVPLTLVEESRDPSAPLHACFEWDDSEAATLYREDQARTFIRSLKIVYVRNDTEDVLPPIRAYVSVVDDPGLDMYVPGNPGTKAQRHYRPIVHVMSEQDIRDRYVQTAFEALASWRQRYRDIEAFADIFVQIDALKERLQKTAA